MRTDSIGLFWEDVPPKHTKKVDLLSEQGWREVIAGYWVPAGISEDEENDLAVSLDTAYTVAKLEAANVKREPPEPTWLHDDYLPNLEEARRFDVPLFTDKELVEAANEQYTGKKHVLVFDAEVYINYFLVAFKSATTGKCVYFEKIAETGITINTHKLRWIFDNFCCVGFNSLSYDLTVCAIALAGRPTTAMKWASDKMIVEGYRPGEVLKQYKLKKLQLNHIDIINVAPLFGSLKVYGGRMHSERLQDLPFVPNKVLTDDQIAITRLYCINDLNVTLELYVAITPEIELREKISIEYETDLRSKSDAQIAEVIIGSQVKALNGFRITVPEIEPGTQFYYQVPHFIKFSSDVMLSVMHQLVSNPFTVSESGHIDSNNILKSMDVNIGDNTFRMGIGGLHSSEKKRCTYSSEDYVLVDRDVASYYPFIILNCGLYPSHLGPNFLQVYRNIVDRRIAAKRSGDKTTADTLKIAINGSFGKLGSKYSIFYSPDLLLQVTITGQLALLMLIERLEAAGIPVISANTDGVVMRSHKQLVPTMEAVVKQWEAETNFETEATYYKALLSRDVNNYIALVQDPAPGTPVDKQVKTKGIFASAGLSKNPVSTICIDAVKHYLVNDTPVRETIENCKDLTKFICLRAVKGGAVQVQEGEPNLYLGKTVRWYYAKDLPTALVYAKNGNLVPMSKGARAVMDLPSTYPNDIDYDKYVADTNKILVNLGLEV